MSVLHVVGVNLIDRFVTFGDGTTGAITSMLDEWGDDTDHPEIAVAIMAEHKSHGVVFMALPDDDLGETVQ